MVHIQYVLHMTLCISQQVCVLYYILYLCRAVGGDSRHSVRSAQRHRPPHKDNYHTRHSATGANAEIDEKMKRKKNTWQPNQHVSGERNIHGWGMKHNIQYIELSTIHLAVLI